MKELEMKLETSQQRNEMMQEVGKYGVLGKNTDCCVAESECRAGVGEEGRGEERRGEEREEGRGRGEERRGEERNISAFLFFSCSLLFPSQESALQRAASRIYTLEMQVSL
eukprot:766837-Hanusia_phi.AAC.4